MTILSVYRAFSPSLRTHYRYDICPTANEHERTEGQNTATVISVTALNIELRLIHQTRPEGILHGIMRTVDAQFAEDVLPVRVYGMNT